MNKNGWMVLVVIAGLAFVLAFSGCARTPEMPEATLVTEPEPAEGLGEEPPVYTEEIEPIQPKELTDIGFEFDRFDLSPEARATSARR